MDVSITLIGLKVLAIIEAPDSLCSLLRTYSCGVGSVDYVVAENSIGYLRWAGCCTIGVKWPSKICCIISLMLRIFVH